MVQLANSEKLAIRYAPYIQELRDFFALHDVLCGAPRELGFFAARLSGRDTFPDEFASMVRSFIFREGGAFPLADLRTVVAVAVGGPAVAQSAGELQHPLHDLSTFLAAVSRSSLDQPLPTYLADVALEDLGPLPFAAMASSQSSTDTAEPIDSDNPFRPHLASGASLAAARGGPLSQQMSPTAFPKPVRNRRTLWAAFAVGLPLVLLFAFLYHQSAETNPSPDIAAASSPTPSSLSSPAGAAPTPLSNAVQALAHPASANAALQGPSSPSATGQPRAATSSQSASASASRLATGASQPFAAPAGTSSSSPASTAAAAAPASSPSAPPAPSPSTPAASSSAPGPSPPRAAPSAPSVATVTAQQGAFGVSSGIMSSHLISFSPPRYPKMADFTHAQGQVILQAVVSKTGKVSAVKAITGPRTLRKAAEKAVRQWRYRPYVIDGHAADVATIVTIDIKAPH